MQIIVKHEGSNKTITLTVEPSNTIKNVKDQIKNENAFPLPVPLSEMRLVLYREPNLRSREELEDDNTLLSYDIIRDGCEIVLFYRHCCGDRKLDEDDCRICHNSTSKPSVQYFSDPSNTDGLKVAVGICGHKVR